MRHRRYGYLGKKSLQRLANSEMLEQFNYNSKKVLRFVKPVWVENTTVIPLTTVKDEYLNH